jgi:hypothetical protein
MPNHKTLDFTKLHKAKFNAGDAADLPADPDGAGDIFWAPDDNTLYVADFAGTSWLDYDLSGTGGGIVTSLDDVGDVNAVSPTADQILYWDTGASKWQAKTLPNFLTDFKLANLVDVTLTGAAKGNLIVRTSSNFVNLGVGTNGQVLQADSAQTTGTKWTTLDLVDTVANYANFVNQSGNPGSTPPSGKTWMFVKSNDLYLKTSGGTIIGPFLTTATNGSLDDLTDVVITSAAKGDVVGKSSTNWVNVPVGSNGEVLTANSSATAGFDWQPVSSPAADFELSIWLGMV